MADEWTDDCPKCRKVFRHALRSGYQYQSGTDTEAPSLVFADADYEVGDGKCGLWEDGKQANEPAIVYVRADAYLSALADARRYQHLRQKDLETVHDGGVFAGITPDNVVLNLEDLDQRIDDEMNGS